MSSQSNLQNRQTSRLEGIGQAIKKCDLFYTDKFLKFRGEEEHTTYTGAFCSIILISVFVIIFFSTAISTINREKANHSISYYRPTEPIVLGQKGKQAFLMSVGIQGINLLKLPLFFQIQILLKVSQRGKVTKQLKHNLQRCKKQNWKKLSEQAGNIFDQLQMSEWLCLPPNLELELNGTNSAPELTYAQLVVTRCNPTHFACVNDTQFQQFLKTNGFFNLKVYFTNPSISPGQTDYLKYYLDDTNHYSFTHKTGVSANLYFSEYTIETEEQIMPEPLSTKKVQKGVFMDSTLDAVNNYPVDSQILAKVGFRKSINSIMYQRSYRRVDDALSYIGGLFGGLIMLMLLMKKFNEYSFQLQLSSIIFFQKVQEGRFHLVNYFIYLFYMALNFLTGQKLEQSFPLMSKYHKCRQQIQEQLSVDYLLKRIIFLEKVIEINFDPKDLEGISLHHKMSLDTLKNKRQFYDNNKEFKSAVKESIKRRNSQTGREVQELSMGRLQNREQKKQKNKNKSQTNNNLEKGINYKITQIEEEKKALSQKKPNQILYRVPKEAQEDVYEEVQINSQSPYVDKFTLQNKKQREEGSSKMSQKSKNRPPLYPKDVNR